MVKITRRVIEVVITGLIRNQFESNLTWVRIPHPPPKDEFANGFSPFAGSFFTMLKRGSFDSRCFLTSTSAIQLLPPFNEKVFSSLLLTIGILSHQSLLD